jgi:pimeloyl-ACP methyl ester carboxylesterase
MQRNRFNTFRVISFALISGLILQCCASKEVQDVQSFTSGYADVNGLHMYYETYGSGKPLVLIHGGGSTIGTTFGNIIPILARTHRVIAVELQAHGHTGDREGPESFEQDADDVAALVKYLKVDKADFFGFSNGGSTTMQIGIRHPDLANKLVIASAFYKREGMFEGFFDMLQHASLDNMPLYLKEEFNRINHDSTKLRRMFELDKNRMLSFVDWKDEDLAKIKAPSLVVSGDRDVATNIHTATMATKIPNARLLIVPANHGSFMSEAGTSKSDSKIPELTIAAIEEFLNDASDRK